MATGAEEVEQILPTHCFVALLEEIDTVFVVVGLVINELVDIPDHPHITIDPECFFVTLVHVLLLDLEGFSVEKLL